ncbi:MAG TPA: ShlB/FhaC/HecB family hemolysin secretion/activation protein [Steroidobacteraceae bacterium]|jgi:hemolysin activation/secretion protein|nr:ShlB/FhaC/HecB family hemolysin secretion/activation protein [Steroidobacteraceae bacterium]
MIAKLLSGPALGLLLLVSAPVLARAATGNTIGAFDIARFEVEGNTLLDPATIRSLLAGYAGKGRDFGYVERAVGALQEAYRKRGFSLVKVVVPEQELNQGVVRLQVVESRIGKVLVQGNAFHDEANIRRSLPALEEGAIPNTDALSTDLEVANENPTKNANLQLRGSAQPGVIDAVVQVADEKTWSAGALLDNSGFDPSGRNHITLQYQNFNLWGLDHVFSVQYTTSLSNPSKLDVYGAGYHIPLYAEGDSLDFYGSYSNINAGSVSAGLVDLTVSGAGSVFGAHYNHEWPRIGHYDSQLIVGFDRKAFRNDIELLGLQLSGDVTVDPLSLSYVGRWALPSGNWNFYLTGVRNIPGGAQASDTDFTAARSGATPGYGLLRYGAGYDRPLAGEWRMRLTVNGQATRDALVPGEQFGVGGAASVRGLHEREISDDEGFTASAELDTPNLCAIAGSRAMQCLLFGFFDDGRVSRNDALPGEETHVSVDSSGMGFRLARGRALSLQMDYGHVVSASDAQQRGEQRFDVSLAVTF